MAGRNEDKALEAAAAWRFRRDRGALAPADEARFRAWLAADPRHRAAYAEVERTWSLMGTIPRPAAPPPPAPGRAPLTRRVALGGLAAAAVATVALHPRLAETADIRTRVGELREVALPDGSTMALNGDGAVALAFDDERRGVRLLRGEAFFLVVAEPRPFEVETEGGVSRALGTAWAVRTVGGDAVVTVLQGAVAVRTRAGGSATLSAGEQARYGRAGVSQPRPADAAAETAWRRGRLIVVDRPLGDVIAALDRHHPARLMVVDPGVADRRVNGVFDLSQPEQALAAIEASLGLNSIDLAGAAVLVHR